MTSEDYKVAIDACLDIICDLRLKRDTLDEVIEFLDGPMRSCVRHDIPISPGDTDTEAAYYSLQEICGKARD